MICLCYSDTDPNPVLLSESQLTQYILATTCQKVEAMRTAPDYKQIKYSRSNFKYLSEISKLIFRNFVQHLKNVIDKFDTKTAQLSVECLRQCLTTAVKLYKRKFNDFLLVLRNYLFFKFIVRIELSIIVLFSFLRQFSSY